ncbi:MAG TPA: hypothetical protein PLP27_07575 [Crocinitomicaceae bacterium]|nr:hypothetical protein [Crocinitomicaceae bacterium]
MKKSTVILVGMFLLATVSFGQTSAIALKSHAGNADELASTEDNFGIINPAYEYANVDSVKYFAIRKIVVEYRTNQYNNTFYADTFNYKNEDEQTIMEHLKVIRLNSYYPKKTKFINFPRAIEKLTKSEINFKQYGISLWFFVLLLLLGAKRKNFRQKTA